MDNGNPTGATPQPAASPQPTGAAAAPAATSGGLTSNVAGALAYVLGLITGVIFLVLEPHNKDKFVRFHAFQSIFFNVGYIVFWIAWTIISGIVTHMIPLAGFLFFAIDMLIGLAFFLVWLFLMYQAYSNKTFKLPIIGDIAAKQAGV